MTLLLETLHWVGGRKAPANHKAYPAPFTSQDLWAWVTTALLSLQQRAKGRDGRSDQLLSGGELGTEEHVNRSRVDVPLNPVAVDAEALLLDVHKDPRGLLVHELV